MANVSVGQEAPDFTLRNEANQEVTLSSLRGRPVVLVFYPLDFSPFCTTEMCTYRDDYSSFEAKGAQVFGISRDSTWTHKAFKEKEGLTHGLLADMKGDVAKLYGCWRWRRSRSAAPTGGRVSSPDTPALHGPGLWVRTEVLWFWNASLSSMTTPSIARYARRSPCSDRNGCRTSSTN
jgi:peroxiredoxin